MKMNFKKKDSKQPGESEESELKIIDSYSLENELKWNINYCIIQDGKSRINYAIRVNRQSKIWLIKVTGSIVSYLIADD